MQQSQKTQILGILEEMKKLIKQNNAWWFWDNILVSWISLIESAISRIKEEVKDDNWIPVSERLPEEWKKVFIIWGDKVIPAYFWKWYLYFWRESW